MLAQPVICFQGSLCPRWQCGSCHHLAGSRMFGSSKSSMYTMTYDDCHGFKSRAAWHLNGQGASLRSKELAPCVGEDVDIIPVMITGPRMVHARGSSNLHGMATEGRYPQQGHTLPTSFWLMERHASLTVPGPCTFLMCIITITMMSRFQLF